MGTVVAFLRKLCVHARFVRLAWVFATVLVLASSTALAQANQGASVEVRTIYPAEWGVPNRGGLTYSANLNQFFLLKQGRSDQSAAGGSTLVTFTPYEDLVDVVSLDFSIDDATNVAFDDRNNRLLLLNSQPAELVQIQIGREGKPDLATLTRFDVAGLGLQSAQGIVVDGQDPALLILDSQARQLVRVTLTSAGPDLAAVSKVDLAPLGLTRLRGLAVNPTNQHLVVVGGAEQKLYELTVAGQLVKMFDPATLGLVAPRSLVFAPSADLTDAPDIFHLFLLDSKQVEDQVASEPSQLDQVVSRIYLPFITQSSQDGSVAEAVESAAIMQHNGEIIEVALAEAGAPVQAAATNVVLATLVRTTLTSQFSPPSPDPSGIAYLPASGTLLISDGEVDEMPPYYAGKSLFETTLAGVLVRSLPTSFSDEPVGVDVNPANRHLFISDDTGTRTVYEVNPGTDGQYATSDDVVTSIRTNDFGSSDPEGVGYDPTGSGAIIVIDGTNREIYRVAPGANGIFDGVPPRGDDTVTHFDTQSLGLDDPEGGTFNPFNGHIYAVGKPATRVFELTTAGVVVQQIDISAANARKPAGLALAPGSQNPAQMSIYIVDRGVDNDSNPNENDGKLYEFALGIPLATPTNTPTATPTNTPAPPTATPTVTNTPTNTPTPTDTPTPGPPTDTPTMTNTPLPMDTPTMTDTPTNTPLPTDTPTATGTSTPTNTPTSTPTPTNTPIVTVRTFAPEADARVLQANPTTNYGTTTKLSVDSPGEDSYLRFTVTGVVGAVQSARLRVFATDSSSNGPAVYGTSNSWVETAITWNNRPAPTSGAVDNKGAIASNTWVEFNVTALVTGNGTVSFVLLADSTQGVTLRSREGTSPPQLVVTFTGTP